MQHLGDTVADALSIVGITPDKVTEWLGKDCGCEERKEKLNQLDIWSRRILRGKVEKAEEYLHAIID